MADPLYFSLWSPLRDFATAKEDVDKLCALDCGSIESKLLAHQLISSQLPLFNLNSSKICSFSSNHSFSPNRPFSQKSDDLLGVHLRLDQQYISTTNATNRMHVIVDGAFTSGPNQNKKWTIFYDEESTVADALELLISAIKDLVPELDIQPHNIRMWIFGKGDECSPEECWFQALHFIRLTSLFSLTQFPIAVIELRPWSTGILRTFDPEKLMSSPNLTPRTPNNEPNSNSAQASDGEEEFLGTESIEEGEAIVADPLYSPNHYARRTGTSAQILITGSANSPARTPTLPSKRSLSGSPFRSTTTPDLLSTPVRNWRKFTVTFPDHPSKRFFTAFLDLNSLVIDNILVLCHLAQIEYDPTFGLFCPSFDDSVADDTLVQLLEDHWGHVMQNHRQRVADEANANEADQTNNLDHSYFQQLDCSNFNLHGRWLDSAGALGDIAGSVPPQTVLEVRRVNKSHQLALVSESQQKFCVQIHTLDPSPSQFTMFYDETISVREAIDQIIQRLYLQNTETTSTLDQGQNDMASVFGEVSISSSSNGPISREDSTPAFPTGKRYALCSLQSLQQIYADDSNSKNSDLSDSEFLSSAGEAEFLNENANLADYHPTKTGYDILQLVDKDYIESLSMNILQKVVSARARALEQRGSLSLIPGETIRLELKNCRISDRYDSSDPKVRGTIYVTDYQVAFLADDFSTYRNSQLMDLSVPINSLSQVEQIIKSDSATSHIRLRTKALKSIYVAINLKIDAKRLIDLINQLSFNRPIEKLFAFSNREHHLFALDEIAPALSRIDLAREFERLGLTESPWRLCTANKSYTLSPTYPSIFAVPASITDTQLAEVATFRTKGRLPTVVWRNPRSGATLSRCSQPQVGLFGLSRCKSDEALIKAIHVTNPSQFSKPLFLVDSRPTSNAKANHFKGAGHESEAIYQNCRVVFLDIDNIHVVRAAFNKIYDIFACTDDTKWFKNVDETGWMQLQSILIKGAIKVANLLETHGASVVTHCSDGWDRTPQITCLVELILDEHSRTLVGFLALINKEWCRFGHMFQKRSSHGCKANNESSPIFHQFIDAVWQLFNQLPTEFEFNEDLLLFLVESCYSCRFGNFLFNTEKEYMANKSNLVCIWSYILLNSSTFINPLFHPSNDPLFAASGRLRDLEMWRGCYGRSRQSQRHQSKMNDKIKSLKSQNDMLQTFLKSSSSSSSSSSLTSASSSASSSPHGSSANMLKTSSVSLGPPPIPSSFSGPSYIGSLATAPTFSSSSISSSSSSSRRAAIATASNSSPSNSVACSLPAQSFLQQYNSSPSPSTSSSSLLTASISSSSPQIPIITTSSSASSSPSSSLSTSSSSISMSSAPSSPRMRNGVVFL